LLIVSLLSAELQGFSVTSELAEQARRVLCFDSAHRFRHASLPADQGRTAGGRPWQGSSALIAFSTGEQRTVSWECVLSVPALVIHPF
jgi:hypothetical protein